MIFSSFPSRLFLNFLTLSTHIAFGSLNIVCNSATSPYQNLTICKPERAINITERDTKIIPHSNGLLYLLYKGLSIDHQIVFYFPIFEPKFHTMQVINITNSHLKEINSTNLQNFMDLRYLQLSGNDLSTIESKTFVFNTKLEFLDLSDNEITQIYDGAFNGLENLKTLKLINNFCVSIEKSSVDDVRKIFDYAVEKCSNVNLKNDTQRVETAEITIDIKEILRGDKKWILIGCGIIGVFAIILICCCICCCCKKKPKNVPEVLEVDLTDCEGNTQV